MTALFMAQKHLVAIQSVRETKHNILVIGEIQSKAKYPAEWLHYKKTGSARFWYGCGHPEPLSLLSATWEAVWSLPEN